MAGPGRPRKVISMTDDTSGNVNMEVVEVNEEKLVGLTDALVEQLGNQETPVENVEPEVKEPEMGSPEWNDFVLSKLTAEEFRDGAPLVDGLRRIAEDVLGPFVHSIPTQTIAIEHQTVVTYSIGILWKRNDARFGKVIEFGGVGDATDENAEFPYNKYRGPLAETRAEGRALKKALGLKRILTAEEVNSELKTDPADLANATQKVAIKNLCSKLKIDLDKFLNLMETENGFESKSMDEMNKELAVKCIQRLNQYQTDSNNKEHQDIPSVILKG